MTGGGNDPRKYDKARKGRKAIRSRVAESSRSKRDFYCEISSDRPSSTPQNAVSAPIASHERKRRRLVKPAATLGRNNADRYIMVPVIEIIDESPEGSKTNKPRAFVQMCSEHVPHGELLYQPGSDSEELESDEVEMIDEEEFMSQNSCSASKIGPSSKGKLKVSTDIPRKDASSSVGYSAAFCPKDAFRGSDHARTHESRACVQIESDSNEDMIPEDMFKIMDGARSRNQKQALPVTYSRRKNRTGPNMLSDSSSILAKKVNNNGHMSCRKTKIKGDDEGKFRNGKSSTMSKEGAFSMQGHSAVHSRKNSDTMKELSIDNYCVSFSEDAGRDSHEEQADRPSSFTETETNEFGFEKVDESEFMKIKQIEFGSGIGSSSNGQDNEVSSSCEVQNNKLVSAENASDRSHSKLQSDDEDEDEDIPEKTEATSSVVTGKNHDVCSMLADVVLGMGQITGNDSVKGDKVNHEESKQLAPATQTQHTLPVKFCFEDLVPKPVEKTDSEKDIEEGFNELACSWEQYLEESRTFEYPEVDLGNEIPAEETQHDRCCRGEHELIHEDDKGLFCMFCLHTELEPKDIMPEWIGRSYRGSARKRYSKREETSEFDVVNFQSSMDIVADCDATGTVWSINPGARESLYEHQREGFEFLWKNLAGSINVDEVKSKSSDSDGVGGCIISHAPGTGKTRLTIVFIESYLRMFSNSRPVIIAPAGMLLTWEEEFKKWDVGYPFLNLNNTDLSIKDKSDVGHLTPAKTRDLNYIRMIKIYSWSRGGSVLGISYSLFEKLVGENKTTMKREASDQHQNDNKMRQILLEMPGLVILDEGHTPRNQRSNIWNALLKLETQKRVILSGTPFQNNFLELFNLLRIVRPAVADMLAREKTYAGMVSSRRMSSSREHQGGHGHSQSHLISKSGLEKLKVCMSPFVHVHKGTILQQSLPGLTDSVVVLKPTTLQKSLIEGIQGSNSFKNEHVIALISVHPSLFLHDKSTKAQMEGIDMNAVTASKLNPREGVKTRFVLELVRLSMAVDEKVLVFSQYIQPLVFIREQLKGIFKWVDGRQILMMRGKLDQKQRQTLIKSFNDPKGESKIMLASTRCCSEGISLVGASRVVLLDVVWNPSVERQAISRAYRIGQKKCVYTYHLMTSGTSEAEKYCRQAEKEHLSDLVFTSENEENHPSECKEDRILEVMGSNQSLKGIFEKIINQPKETDLLRTFGL